MSQTRDSVVFPIRSFFLYFAVLPQPSSAWSTATHGRNGASMLERTRGPSCHLPAVRTHLSLSARADNTPVLRRRRRRRCDGSGGRGADKATALQPCCGHYQRGEAGCPLSRQPTAHPCQPVQVPLTTRFKICSSIDPSVFVGGPCPRNPTTHAAPIKWYPKGRLCRLRGAPSAPQVKCYAKGGGEGRVGDHMLRGFRCASTSDHSPFFPSNHTHRSALERWFRCCRELRPKPRPFA